MNPAQLVISCLGSYTQCCPSPNLTGHPPGLYQAGECKQNLLLFLCLLIKN
jgi:hypothetical protein